MSPKYINTSILARVETGLLEVVGTAADSSHFCMERYDYCCIYVPKYITTAVLRRESLQHVLLCRKGVAITVCRKALVILYRQAVDSSVPKVDTTTVPKGIVLYSSTERRYTVVPRGVACRQAILLYRQALLLYRQALLVYTEKCCYCTERRCCCADKR